MMVLFIFVITQVLTVFKAISINTHVHLTKNLGINGHGVARSQLYKVARYFVPFFGPSFPNPNTIQCKLDTRL